MPNKWLQNKSFILWRLFPTGESNLYWKTFIKENPELKEEIEKAIRVLETSRLNPEKHSLEEKQRLFVSIQEGIEKENRLKRFRIYGAVSAVACIALILIYFYSEVFNHTKTDLQQVDLLSSGMDSIALKPNEVQLILTNNEVLTLENDTKIQYDEQGGFTVRKENGEVETQKIETKEVAVNTLIVPRGKRSNLVLADGTKVWVNSGTTLKFPAEFEHDKREIWIDGEIYLDVKKNENQPFYVNTSRMVIDVVGTSFNVSAYNEDVEHKVVLVEGCVNVNVDSKKTRLQPDQMLTASINDISVKNVNVADFVSWKDGYLQFSNEELSAILTRLSRYYDIPVISEEGIGTMECKGKLVLFDNLEEVLETICKTLPVEYTIGQDGVFVTKREK